MARGGVARFVILGVDKQIGCGDELIGRLPGKHAIQTLQNIPWGLNTGHDRLHRHLHHRRDKCRRDAVSGDVGYQDVDAVLIVWNKFVKVTCYGGHRMVRGGNTEIFRFRTAAGKNRGLYLAGDL